MEALILSYALDTNGQNARYVRAAEKHPDVLALAIGNQDPAGVVTRLKMAADKGGELHIRSAHRSTAYFDFPTDIVWTRKTEALIRDLAEQADVIHLNNSEMAYKHFRLHKKPALLHHHGSLFRNNPERMLMAAKHYKFQQCVSTIDLQRPAPHLLPWLPTAYDIDDLQAFGAKHARPHDGRVRIVHAPTNRDLKHTALFLEAVRQLQEEGLPVDLDLVEHETWAACMGRKAKADIVYDQLAFGYGCNAVEAWGMGIPVVAGGEDWTLTRMTEQWGGLPFVEANEATLKDVLRHLVKSKWMRDEWGQRGLAHVRKYHDERAALAILAELYMKAIRQHARMRIPGKADAAVTFRKVKGGTVYLEDSPIRFEDGVITTDDPLVIERLRTLAKRPLRFGIEEVA